MVYSPPTVNVFSNEIAVLLIGAQFLVKNINANVRLLFSKKIQSGVILKTDALVVYCRKIHQSMKDQNFSNHPRLVPGFHILGGALLLLGTIAAFVNVYFQVSTHDSVLGSILIAILFIIGLLLFWFTRTFAVTVQDRAIRAEEGLRYYI